MPPVREISTPTAGQPLARSLRTPGGRLLAAAGTVLTDEMSSLLTEAGIADEDLRRGGAPDRRSPSSEMESAEPEAKRLSRIRAALRQSGAGPLQLAQTRWGRMALTVEVGADPVLIDESPRALGAEEPLKARRAAGVAAVHSALAHLLAGDRTPIGPLTDAAEDLIDAAARSAPQYSIPALGLPRPVDSPSEHAYSTGALAIGMAARLGWPRADVLAIGVAGFLCDAGLGLLTHDLRRLARPLTDIELNAARRHPAHSVTLARRLAGSGSARLPECALLAIFQHHERMDGGGYPLGAKADRLHDYSRVLAVADVFAGMTAPRAHRPALTPAAAMGELAHQSLIGARGAFDRAATRALLDLLGLYPAGSTVRLSNGRVARVAASARPGAPDRPVIRVHTGSVLLPAAPVLIDLAAVPPGRLRVVEAAKD